jgi:hypothetical protein
MVSFRKFLEPLKEHVDPHHLNFLAESLERNLHFVRPKNGFIKTDVRHYLVEHEGLPSIRFRMGPDLHAYETKEEPPKITGQFKIIPEGKKDFQIVFGKIDTGNKVYTTIKEEEVEKFLMNFLQAFLDAKEAYKQNPGRVTDPSTGKRIGKKFNIKKFFIEHSKEGYPRLVIKSK